MLKFRVYPGCDPANDTILYWEVRVYANRGQMIRGFNKLNKGVHKWEVKPDFEAIVLPQQRFVKEKTHWVVQPDLGFVLFDASNLTPGHIAHEATHMGVDYLRIAGPNKLPRRQNGDNESLAYAVGCCVEQITKALGRKS
jgi:hypothetical protein